MYSLSSTNRDNNSEPMKPESLAYETALRNELLGEKILEIPVSQEPLNLL